MRKLILLCAAAMLSLSPLAAAQITQTAATAGQNTPTPEATLKAYLDAQMETGLTLEQAYDLLISADSDVLSAEQKAALTALGPQAGVLFLTSVQSGDTYDTAGAIAVTAPGTTNEQATTLIAKLRGTTQTTVFDTAAGTPGAGNQTPTGTGTNTGGTTGAPVGGGNGGGGGGGGGVVGSGN